MSPPFSTLTYRTPEYLDSEWFAPGMRVAAPVGHSLRAVCLVEPASRAPENVALKELLWPLEREALLRPDYLDLCANLASRQMTGLGRILHLVLPRGLRSAAVNYELLKASGTFGAKLSSLAHKTPDELAALAKAWRDGAMRIVRRPADRADPFVVPACDPPWPVRPGATRQVEILEHLFEHGARPRRSLLAALGPQAAGPLKTLASRGLVRFTEEPDGFGEEETVACEAPPVGHDPTPGQQEALAELETALDSASPQVRLLHGITGSGKTLVYLQLARRCLESGRQVLLLAPEVALACALFKAAREALPDFEVHLHHGYQSPARREARFEELGRSKEPVLVVGTRSALFLPLRDAGLVVLDEEHDESFKQEERLAYQAKEVAWYRMDKASGLLVLGSATPDVKTYHAARTGTIPMVSMPRRVGRHELPEVELVDAAEVAEPGLPLAQASLDALRATVEQGGQAVVMLNRRGYAPLMYCPSCEAAVKCPHCRVALTYHKARERLLCHYCGLSLAYPCLCPECSRSDFVPLGEGTERLEERLAQVLPESAGVLRLDRDAARRQERMEAILADFRAGKAKVLVGTQMLSKGHHFPGVTLVIAAEADLGLNLPDYRASERAFQLMVQVSGRAGRGELPGKVLIQTRSPGHRFWKHVLDADYETFYGEEIELRRRFGYPPFAKLGLIRASFPVPMTEGPQLLQAMAKRLRERAAELGVRLLGPTPSPLSQLKGRKRFQCLVKADAWPEIRTLYAEAHRLLPGRSEMRLSLDLDPVNML